MDDNNYFTAKKRKKARYMDFFIKAIAICVRKKIGYYCKNNN